MDIDEGSAKGLGRGLAKGFDSGLLRRIALASTAAGALLCVVPPAFADGSFLSPITNFVTAPFGGAKQSDDVANSAIDYSPRPALVVPPTDDLPPPHKEIKHGADWPKDPDGAALRRAKADSRRPAPSADSRVSGDSVAAVNDPPEPARKQCDLIQGQPYCYDVSSGGGFMAMWPSWLGGQKNNDSVDVHLNGSPQRTYLSDPPVTYLEPVPMSPEDQRKSRSAKGAAGQNNQCMFPGWFGCPERDPTIVIGSSVSTAPSPAAAAPAPAAPATPAQPQPPAANSKCMFPGWFGCPAQ